MYKYELTFKRIFRLKQNCHYIILYLDMTEMYQCVFPIIEFLDLTELYHYAFALE